MVSFLRFVGASLRATLRGGWLYRVWLAFLVALLGVGIFAYVQQLDQGLIATNMRDQVSWAFYIGNFTFMVGVAAAAVLVVIPAYVYRWGPLKEIAILGEILAISAVMMAIMFVLVDIGRPERIWQLIPGLGRVNFPNSMLAWDALVLNLYLVLNAVIVGHVLYTSYQGRPYRQRLIVPLVLFSIPAAIAIHTVTAFLYNGMAARSFWNESILAPRFLASAFASGPAILVVVLQILRWASRIEIKDEAIQKLAELMAYAMALNLFLLGAEVFVQFYSQTSHAVYLQYLYFGLHGHNALVPYAWASVIACVIAFCLLLIPASRRHPITLNLGCLLIFTGVYIEKGMGLVIPGMTPDTLGEIFEYVPSWVEIGVGVGILAAGFLVFTVLIKVATEITHGDLRAPEAPPQRLSEPRSPTVGREREATT